MRALRTKSIALSPFACFGAIRAREAGGLGVVMRERPAFRSTFAKHALHRGRGICRARPRHKALLGKPCGDGAKAAAVIQLARRLDHFWAQLGNAFAALALAAALVMQCYSTTFYGYHHHEG